MMGGMTEIQGSTTICRCDGRYEGCDHPNPCARPGGGYRSDYFCIDCDPRRIASITSSLDSFVAEMERPD